MFTTRTAHVRTRRSTSLLVITALIAALVPLLGFQVITAAPAAAVNNVGGYAQWDPAQVAGTGNPADGYSLTYHGGTGGPNTGDQVNYCTTDSGQTWQTVWIGTYPNGDYGPYTYTWIPNTLQAECYGVPNANGLMITHKGKWVATFWSNGSAPRPLSAREAAGGSNPAVGCGCRGASGDPVSNGTGEFFETVTDMTLPGRTPFAWSRTYSTTNATTDGVLGYGWSAPVNARIDTTSVSGSVLVVQENGSVATFQDNNDGTYFAPTGTFATLTKNATTGEWTFKRRNTVTYTFDANGNVTSVTDRNGETITFNRAPDSTLTGVTTPDGRTLTITVTAGRITSITGPSAPGTPARTVSYTYDTSGNLWKVTDSRGKTWTYLYDSAHRVTDMTSPLAETTHNVYDTQGRVTDQTSPRGKTTHWDYTVNGNGQNVTTITDPTGVVTVETYAGGRMISRTVAPNGSAPSTESWAYDQSGLVREHTDPTGVTTWIVHDRDGNAIYTTVAAGPANVTTGAVPGTASTTTMYNDFNQPLVQTDPAGHTTTWTYDTHGNVLTQAVQLNSTETATTTWTRSNPAHHGDVQSMTDPRSKQTTYTYTAEGFLASVTAPAGSQATGASGNTSDATLKTTFTYNPYGDVLTMVDPRGNATGATAATYRTVNTYDDGGLLLTTKTPTGLTTSYGYDDAGRRTTENRPGTGRVWTTYYLPGGLVDHVTDPLTHTVASYGYDAAARVTSVTDAVGNKTTTAYDDHGRKATVTQPSGNVTGVTQTVKDANTTTYGYDAAGRLVSESIPNPSGGAALVQQTVYDAAGRPWKTTNPAGETTITRYDALNRVDQVTDPNGGTIGYGYDWAGRKTTVTDRRGKTTTYGYDLSSNVTSILNANNHTISKAYDDAGRLASITDGRGNVSGATASDYRTTYLYDPAGNLQVVKDPLTHATTTVYDADNRLVTKSNGLTHTTAYGYEATTGRLSTITSPTSNTTTYAYDNADRRTGITSPKGTWTTGYDDAGNITSTTDPATATTTYTFTPENLVKTKTTPRGTITYTYDPLHRLTGRTYTDSTPAVAFTYDKANRRATMTDGIGSTTYTYNPNGWLTGKTTTPTTGTAQTWGYTYDAEGNVKTRTRPDTTVETWSYDNVGNPVNVVSPTGTTTFTFDAAENQYLRTYPNGTAETTTLNRDTAITGITLKKGTTTLVSQTVSRDAADQPTQTVVTRNAASETRKYLYDNNERITDVCYTTATCTATAATQHWTYDADGNRLTERNGTGTGTTTTWIYDSSDRTTSQKIGTATATATVPTYDQDGNTLTDGNGRTYTYNLDGQATTATANGSTITYTYDGDGNRITANTTAGTGAGAKTTYTWDTNASLPVLTGISTTPNGGTATVTAIRYDNGGTGTAITQTVAGTTGWYNHDPLGADIDIVNSTGAIVRSQDFTPYGSSRTAIGASTQSGAPFALGYTGALPNADGTLDLRARDYNPNLGGFNTRDPLADQGSAGYGGWWGSQYGYVNGRVTYLTDPSGRDVCDIPGANFLAVCWVPKIIAEATVSPSDEQVLAMVKWADCEAAKKHMTAEDVLINEREGNTVWGIQPRGNPGLEAIARGAKDDDLLRDAEHFVQSRDRVSFPMTPDSSDWIDRNLVVPGYSVLKGTLLVLTGTTFGATWPTPDEIKYGQMGVDAR